MRTNSSVQRPRMRAVLLSTASAVILGSGAVVAHKATAATTEIDAILDILATGTTVVTADQLNAAPIAAEVLNALIASGVVNVSGTTAGTTDVSVNLIGAFATGNSFVNAAGTGLMDPDGVAALGLSINAAPVNSEVSGNTISATELGFTSGSVANIDNLITAQTTLNEGETTVEGTVPNGFVSVTPGIISFDSDFDPILSSAATIATTSAQLNTAGASTSQALVEDNAVTLTLTPLGAGEVVDASPVLDGNTLSAEYRGNTATSEVSIEAGVNPTFAGSIALTNLQANEDVVIDGPNALNAGSTVAAVVGSEVDGVDSTLVGTLSVSGNTISSSAVGNEALGANGPGSAGNLIALEEGMNFAGPGGGIPGSSLAYDSGEVDADVAADLALLNHQSNIDSSLGSQTSGAQISALVQSLEGGGVDVSGNTASSRAVGNTASNAILGPGIDQTGTNSFVGTAALASGQVNWNSAVSADTIGVLIDATIGNASLALGDSFLTDSTVTLDGNAIRSTAIGNQVGNGLAIGANEVDLGDEFASIIGLPQGPTPGDGSLVISGGATVLNVQDNIDSVVNAQTSGAAISLDATDLTPGTPISDSTLEITDSAISATAAGSSASNELAIEANGLTGSAGLGNLQLSDNSFVDATVSESGVSLTAGAEDVDIVGSSLSVGGNAIDASAWGASATNRLSVTANEIDMVSLVPLNGLTLTVDLLGDVTVEAGAAYALQNVQTGAESVTATIGTTDVLLQAASDVFDSSLTAIGNSFTTLAVNNQANNALSLDANSIATSSGVQSYQLTSSNTVATTGAPGTPPIDAVNFIGALSTSVTGDPAYSFDGGTGLTTVTLGAGETLQIDVSGLTADEITALQNLLPGWTLGGGFLTAGPNTSVTFNEADFGGSTFTVSLGDLTDFVLQDFTAPAVPGTPGSPSVIIAIGGNSGAIIDSTVAIGETGTFATAISNDVVNSLEVSATNLAPGGATDPAVDLGASVDDDLELEFATNADHALSNVQVLESGITEADANSTLGIRIDDPLGAGFTEISGSSLSIDDNLQQAYAVGNRADNELALDATNIGVDGEDGVSSSLLSGQLAGGAEVIATSWSEIYSPAAMQGSSLSLSDNLNSAVARVNQADNVLQVAAVNIATADPAENASADLDFDDPLNPLLAVTADHTLFNGQLTEDSEATSTATTHIYNQELGGATDFGLASSSVSLNGNVTEASAVLNQATNLLDLEGSATLSATGALINGQFNFGGSAIASATGDVELLLNSDTVDTVTSSSVSLSDNTVSAAARGNSATNVLNATAGAAYTGLTAGPASSSTTGILGPDPVINATANYVVLNAQHNEADVSASVTGSVSASLQGGVTNSVSSSTIGVSGNRFEASAVGNAATNTMTVAALNTGNPSVALSSSQRNTGNITATANNVTIGVDVGGAGRTGSTVGVSGNRITASATGNSVVNRVGLSN